MAGLSNLIAIMALFHLAMPCVDAAESSAARGTRQIYRCEVAGVATFSDRPCGTEARPLDLELTRISILEATPAPSRPGKAAPGRSSVRHRTTAPGQSDVVAKAAKAEACRRLQQSLRKIASRMRAGYTAKAGERLQEQRRELEAKRRERRC